MKNGLSAADGTTLAELAIVIAILGILLTAAVPGFHRIRRSWLLWGSAHMVESSLLWGRMQAITTNESLLFEVEDEGRGFRWRDPAGGEYYENTARRFPQGVRIIRSPRSSLRFYQHGNAAPAGSFVVESDAGSFRVVVNLRGRIRMEKGD